jgi:hypothetical protein
LERHDVVLDGRFDAAGFLVDRRQVSHGQVDR